MKKKVNKVQRKKLPKNKKEDHPDIANLITAIGTIIWVIIEAIRFILDYLIK
jgi:hypothetical protein